METRRTQWDPATAGATRRGASRAARRRGGFTIVEFMVAVGLLAVLMLGVSSSVTSQHRTYVVVDQVAEAKQNVRVVAGLLERELRNAGYMVPNTGAACGLDAQAGTDRLYVSDYGAIVGLSAIPAESLAQSLGAVIQGGGGVGAGGQTLTVDTTDLDGVGGGNDFQVNGGVIITDRNGAMTGAACGVVTGLGPGANQIQVTMDNATGGLVPGAELVAIPAIVYEVVNGQLLRNDVPLVDQVDDFQVAWFFDQNGDFMVDPGDWLADGAGADDDYEPENEDGTLLREVRINVVIRTRDADPNPNWQGGIGQVTENRTPGSAPGNDGVRRRVHTSTVRLRNVRI